MEENKDPNHIWLDIANLLIPKDMNAKDMYSLIVKGLRERDYTGDVIVRMVFSKTTEHITLESLSEMGNIQQRDLGYYSEIPAKDTADDAIRREIDRK